MIIKEKKSAISLLLHYLFIYPAYYLVAMALSSAFAAWYMDWGYEAGKRYFIILGIIMWLASYVIHFDILRFSIREMNRKNKM